MRVFDGESLCQGFRKGEMPQQVPAFHIEKEDRERRQRTGPALLYLSSLDRAHPCVGHAAAEAETIGPSLRQGSLPAHKGSLRRCVSPSAGRADTGAASRALVVAGGGGAVVTGSAGRVHAVERAGGTRPL